MTSPVDTTVKWARSTMPGAPVLTRAAGSLIALLDALGVDGWGVQTATTVVVANGFATATFPSDHAAAPHAVVFVAGVTGALAGLNGEQKITSVQTNKIKWATALADGTATGTITVKMAAAGWTKPFSGTNLAVYKSASPQAHGQFFRVNDATNNYARIIGYENMTAVSTGTGLFPSSSQLSGGYYWGKTKLTTSDAVPWMYASDGRTSYLYTMTEHDPIGNPNGGLPFLMLFGDLVPEAIGADPFATITSGSLTAAGYDTTATEGLLTYEFDSVVSAARARTGIGASIRGALRPLVLEVDGVPTLPSPITGAIPCGPCHFIDVAGGHRRARLPGFLRSVGNYAEKLQISKFGIVGGAGPQRAYVYVPSEYYTYAVSNLRAVLMDVTGPWR